MQSVYLQLELAVEAKRILLLYSGSNFVVLFFDSIVCF